MFSESKKKVAKKFLIKTINQLRSSFNPKKLVDSEPRKRFSSLRLVISQTNKKVYRQWKILNIKLWKKNYFQPKTRFHSISLYISVIYRTPYPQYLKFSCRIILSLLDNLHFLMLVAFRIWETWRENQNVFLLFGDRRDGQNIACSQ